MYPARLSSSIFGRFGRADAGKIARQRAVSAALVEKGIQNAAVLPYFFGRSGAVSGGNGKMARQYFRLLFHIQFGKTDDAAEGGAVVGAAAEVAAPRPQKQSAQPGLEAVLPLPDVGQFVYQPDLVGRAGLGKIVQIMRRRVVY